MSSFYDEIEIDDMNFDEATKTFTYPCPCGDKFEIYIDDLYYALSDLEEAGGELPADELSNIAICPSCSLQILCIGDLQDVIDVYEKIGMEIPK
ncbi:hypothetical protein ACO0OL_001902 [Hanseniaspora opuntiae]|uniref:Diphthamide biosynthesis protein 3 n=1 Tax=Hanseniaspora opuntiae TaxID=211096 RepID=A0A1E5RSP9_9ASCO|nr:Diphthamide biosynthesis protein 3 [Hanseniaspora opuntiae]